MSIFWIQTISIILGSTASAVIIAYVFLRHRVQENQRPIGAFYDKKNQVSFLFNHSKLVDATQDGWQTFMHSKKEKTDLLTVIRTVIGQFPTIHDTILNMSQGQKKCLTAANGSAKAEIESWDNLLRISVCGMSQKISDHGMNVFMLDALKDKTKDLQFICDNAPYAIWQTDCDNTITWVNSFYLKLAKNVLGEAAIDTWPPKAIIDISNIGGDQDPNEQKVVSFVNKNSGEKYWFHLANIPYEDGTIHFAINANDLVYAQSIHQNLIQTFTKTFSQLSVGLAIFDKDRCLTLFNPALHDLLSVPIGFLAKKPQLVNFLDRLRDDRIIPEPKNYKTWRDQIASLEIEAVNGTYCELWSMPGGITYRVTGRPHPDGAIAFTFEDISAEMSMTRNFKSEIDLNHAMLDALTQAICVFRNDGTLVYENKRYAQMWTHSNTGTTLETNVNIGTKADIGANTANTGGFIEPTLHQSIDRWQTLWGKSPLWAKISNTICASKARKEWEQNILNKTGKSLNCRVIPLKEGHTMVCFDIPQRIKPDQKLHIKPSQKRPKSKFTKITPPGEIKSHIPVA